MDMSSVQQSSAPDARAPSLRVLLANPRGFCAGVERAIEIVEQALLKYGSPVYVRHEIVHNKYVVDSLRAKGAVFVEELDEVPEGVPVVFSAHGVPKSVPAEAARPTRAAPHRPRACPPRRTRRRSRSGRAPGRTSPARAPAPVPRPTPFGAGSGRDPHTSPRTLPTS